MYEYMYESERERNRRWASVSVSARLLPAVRALHDVVVIQNIIESHKHGHKRGSKPNYVTPP